MGYVTRTTTILAVLVFEARNSPVFNRDIDEKEITQGRNRSCDEQSETDKEDAGGEAVLERRYGLQQIKHRALCGSTEWDSALPFPYSHALLLSVVYGTEYGTGPRKTVFVKTYRSVPFSVVTVRYFLRISSAKRHTG